MIDLDGLEGVKFTEKVDGKDITVVEAEVHIAVGDKGFSQKEVGRIGKKLNSSFDKMVDGQKVDFRFSIKTFDPESTSASDKASELGSTSIVETGTPDENIEGLNKRSITAMAIGKGKLPNGVQGLTNVNNVTISDAAIDPLHTITHETGHFLLLGSENQPQTREEHDNAGGIFKYGVRDQNGGIIEATQGVSKSNIRQILQNVPDKKKEN